MAVAIDNSFVDLIDICESMQIYFTKAVSFSLRKCFLLIHNLSEMAPKENINAYMTISLNIYKKIMRSMRLSLRFILILESLECMQSR